jgi:protein-L-isoaspartate(D-aspartate) O-methyltransferase
VAHTRLADTGVELVHGSLVAGHPAGAPYDLILIDGAVEYIPDALIAQLKDGGRLAAALLEDGISRVSIGRRAGEGFGMAAVTDRASAFLPGFSKPRGFTF